MDEQGNRIKHTCGHTETHIRPKSCTYATHNVWMSAEGNRLCTACRREAQKNADRLYPAPN